MSAPEARRLPLQVQHIRGTPSQTETPQTPSHPLTPSSSVKFPKPSWRNQTELTETQHQRNRYQHPIHDVTYRHQHSTAVSTTLSEVRKQLAVAKHNHHHVAGSFKYTWRDKQREFQQYLLKPASFPHHRSRNRNKTRTAAIAASVISVFLLAGLLFLVLSLKKRRRRILHDKLPEPYTKDREGGTPSSPNGMVRPNLLPTVQKPSAGSSSASQSMPVEPQSAAPLTDIRDRADDADRHHPRSTRIPGPDILAAEEKSRDTPSAGTSSESNFTPVDQQPESAVVSGSMTDDDTPREETLALRLRVQRMEAQLQAILNMSMAEGAPPSYTG
ncbi:hypothetical protein DFH08DRAFT_825420 [Mycena albidolilacea]|uniref:Transmembrane protein n=1 Tax=Mycena albidolilacea TaxID=1033008 RepID=A0AAD7E988_9AGAR|nr:hypothetical protein DFH08DRAFT_825420 [Mycena albidolilacea]